MVIYADMIFFMNFMSASALLYISAIIAGKKVKISRLFTAAIFSGLYSVFETVFFIPYIFRIVILFCTVIISFGKTDFFINTTRIMLNAVLTETIFMFFATATGAEGYLDCGIITVFASERTAMILYAISFPIVYVISSVFKNHLKKRKVQITVNGKTIKRNYIYDSGNFLTHKGLSVAVASWESVSEVFEYESYDDFRESAPEHIIYSAVGKVGMLPAFEPEKCSVNGSLCKIYVAVINNGFSSFGGIIGDIKNKHIREESLCSSLKV